MGDIIDLGKVRMRRLLGGPTTQERVEKRISQLVEILANSHNPHVLAEILVLRNAIWQLDADDAVSHRNQEIPGDAPRPKKNGEP